MEVRYYLRILKSYMSLHLKTAMEYRVNFIIQSGMMFLNDFLYLFCYYFLFDFFKSINGYGFRDVVIIFAIVALAHGWLVFILGNSQTLWQIVTDGKLDFYLSQPVDELYHTLISKSAYDGLGDIMMGVIALIIWAPKSFIIGIFASILGAVVLLGFLILISSLSFVIDNPKSSSKALQNMILGFGSWPIDAFDSPIRTSLYLIPVAYISTVPYKITVSFNFSTSLVLVLVAAGMLALSIIIFKLGIKKYESGNLINIRN